MVYKTKLSFHHNLIYKMLIECQDSPHISLLAEILVHLGDINLEMCRIVSCLKPESTSTLIQASNCSRCTYHQTIFKILSDGISLGKKKVFPVSQSRR